jgi:N-acyl-phosphatidylethanolamine-hydrolysing phospholipase D
MNPQEAVQVFLETACRKAVAMHWGTFQLTDEPMGEAPILLARALEKNSIPPESFRAIHVGDSIEVKPDVSSGK